jgi:hypothetical protein
MSRERPRFTVILSEAEPTVILSEAKRSEESGLPPLDALCLRLETTQSSEIGLTTKNTKNTKEPGRD